MFPLKRVCFFLGGGRGRAGGMLERKEGGREGESNQVDWAHVYGSTLSAISASRRVYFLLTFIRRNS